MIFKSTYLYLTEKLCQQMFLIIFTSPHQWELRYLYLSWPVFNLKLRKIEFNIMTKSGLQAFSAFIADGYLTPEVQKVFKEKLKNYTLPKGYSIQMAGEEEQKAETFGGLGTIILITIFGILAILILEFKTFKSSFIVLSVIPLGVIGAVSILYLTGNTLSFTAIVGIIALAGIEVKNSILLVDYTNYLRKEEGMSIDEAIEKAGKTRFIPIVLTTLTAIGGLIPLVLEHSPLYSPLALVIIGGLISSLILTRIVTPVMYKLLPPSVKD